MSTYVNPVYHASSADPFVLKYRGEYWCYSTGPTPDGRRFGIARSPDLVHWSFVSGALEPLPDNWPEYWAPEVTYHNGRFYLYYSVGNEEHMELRVAVATRPEGPFVDSGRRLTDEQFAIDAHVFVADDGAWHLFYATDFLEHSHIGTGTVQARLRDPFTLAEPPRPVTLPRYSWHVYDPQRATKGGVRWHTVEGPFVLEHKGCFYQMFSGGNWQNTTYGVSYAVSKQLDSPGEWSQLADGEQTLPILRTIPGQVIGPGHNSVVRGPDNRQLFCVYHRWAEDTSARLLSIDPLEWAGERLLVEGPSVAAQPVPIAPSLSDQFDHPQATGLGPHWRCEGGAWSVSEGEARQLDPNANLASALLVVNAPAYLAEVSLRTLAAAPAGGLGVSLGAALSYILEPSDAGWRVLGRLSQPGQAPSETALLLPADFAPEAYHLLRVEVGAGRVAFCLDERLARWQVALPASQLGPLGLCTTNCTGAFAGFALTIGWEDRFERAGAQPAELGWESVRGDWASDDGQLWQRQPQPQALIVKGPAWEHYELLVSARLLAAATPNACYGLCPAYSEHSRPLITIAPMGQAWELRWQSANELHRTNLPVSFDPYQSQLLRIRKLGGQLTLLREGQLLATLAVPPGPAKVALYADQAVAAFDLVRVTALPPEG